MTAAAALSTQDLQAKIMATAARAGVGKVPEKKQQTQQEQLPLPKWTDRVRGVPNAILRSALFGIASGRQREELKEKEVSAFGGLSVRQTGQELNQGDRDVWDQLIHLARTGGLENCVEFSASSFLASIGRTAGGKDMQWLQKAIDRLMLTKVEIDDGVHVFCGTLIPQTFKNKQTCRYVVFLNPTISNLYSSGGWTMIDLQRREALRGHPLAQWLHDFFSTHAEPLPFSVAKIHAMCGSKNRQLRGFRRELREALLFLEEIAGWTCRIDDADLIRVERIPSRSQSRHILRKRLGARARDGAHARRGTARTPTTG